jgi:hypothetical protein
MHMHTSYLLIFSISSSIWCSATVGTVVASPCSALDIATESREVTEGRCWSRGAGRDIEDDREFIASFAAVSYLMNSRFMHRQLVKELVGLDAYDYDYQRQVSSAAASFIHPSE